MSGLDPSGPSQPPVDSAYKAESNPVTTEPSEQQSVPRKHETTTEKRDPSSTTNSRQDATATSLGRGVYGAGPGEETKGRTQEQLDRGDLEGEQIRPPGEGDVAAAVERKSGAGVAQPDLAGDGERQVGETLWRMDILNRA